VKSSLFALVEIPKKTEKLTRVQRARNGALIIIIIISKRWSFRENKIIITNSHLNNNLSSIKVF